MNKTVRSIGTAAAAAVLLLASACGTAPQPSTGAGGPSQLQIVASFYPFQFIAERVAGTHAVVTNLTQPGAEPHDVELTPKQVGSIGEADLVIYEKSFQAAVDEAVEQSGNERVFDTTTAVPLRDLGTEDEEHHAEEGHAEEEHADSGERHLDPHVWLDPVNVATLATALAEKLSVADPDHAADFASNAASLKTQLTTLDKDFRTGLAGCERTQFITQHAAFGYLADRYQLTQIPIGGLSPDVEPSPSRIAEVQQQAKADGITTIFYETLVSPAVAEAIAGDLGLKTDVLDPIEGITAKSKGQDYLEVMRANLASLETANGCR